MTRTAIDLDGVWTFTASLPMPPSINATYRTTRSGGFFKSRAVKSWQDDAAILLRSQGWRRLPQGDYTVALWIRCHLIKRADIDGRIKTIQDSCLRELGIDDSNVMHLDILKVVVPYPDQQAVDIEARVITNT